MTSNISQETDFEWFLTNYSDLYEEYGKKYLAIKNCSVLGAYDSYAEGVRKTSRTEELGTFIVQLCNGTESGCTLELLENTINR